MSIKRYKDIASMQNPGKQRTGKAGGGRVGASNGSGIFRRRRSPEDREKTRGKLKKFAKHPVTQRIYKAVTPGVVQEGVEGVKDVAGFFKKRNSEKKTDENAPQKTKPKKEEEKKDEKKKKSARGGRISRAKGGKAKR